jgi:iron complex outermembrane receptor protein
MRKLKAPLKVLFLLTCCISFNSFSQVNQDTLNLLAIYDLSLYELSKIKIVSVSKTEQKISESPAIIEVIDEKEIELKGFRSVAEALQYISGIYVATDHVMYNAGVRGVIGGRESSSRILKVMINGQPIPFRSTTENFIGTELIPIEMVKRIEVIKGPVSALYGANAFLGVVNVITKTAEELRLNSSFSYGIGNQLKSGLEFATGYKKNKIGILFGIKTEIQDRSGLGLPLSTSVLKTRLNSEFAGVEPFSETTVNDKSKPLSGIVTFSFQDKIGMFLTDAYYQELDNSGRFFNKSPVLNTTRVNINNWFVKETYLKDFMQDKVQLKVSATFSAGKTLDNDMVDMHPMQDQGEKVVRNIGFNGLDLVGEIQYKPSKRINILFGYDYTRNHFDLLSYYTISKSTGSVSDLVETEGVEEFSNQGFYGQLVWRPINNLSILGGVRYDNHNIYGDDLSYSLGSACTFSDNLYVKLLYGTSFNPPSPSQLFSPSTPYNINDGVLGNNNLVPESAGNLEVAAGWVISRNLSVDFNTYYNDIKSLIVIEKIGGLTLPQNKARITTLGYESKLNVKAQKFLGKMSLSYQNSIVTDDGGNESIVALFPEYSINTEIIYQARKINVFLGARYIDEMEASQNNIKANVVLGSPTSYFLDSYYLVDLNVSSKWIWLFRFLKNRSGKSILGVTVFNLGIKNILDQKYSFPGFYKYDIPGLGRQLIFSLKQKI